MTVELLIESVVTTEKDREERRNAARDAVVKVLENHGYNIPGVADLCAGAALRAAGLKTFC